jgi:hypothetical protein
MIFGLRKFGEADMVDTMAGILLVLAVGMCVVAFPFVLWMLFGDGPRSRHKRYTSRRRGNGTTGFSVWSEDRKKTPPWYHETEE